MSEYVRFGESLSRSLPISDRLNLSLRAVDIHKERTGVHARLEIAVGGVTLAWGVINADRDEDRVRLANSAGRQLNGNGNGQLYDAKFLKKDLDDFCRGLWEAEIGRFDPSPLAGLPPAPPDMLLRPFILRGGGTILFGPPGRGKSWISYIWAICVDAGLCQLWPLDRRPVMLINLERSAESVLRRIGAINQALGLPRDRPLHVLNAKGRTLDDVLPAVDRYVRRQHIGLVLLDSISRAGMGDLNENQPANRITDRLNRVCETWVAIGHTPRGSDEHVFGSMHFEAAADILVRLVSEQDSNGGPLGIGLEVTKGNDLPRSWFKMQSYALDMDDDLGLVGIRRAGLGEFPEIAVKRTMSNLERLREWVLDQPAGVADASEAAEATGINRSSVAHLFRTDHFAFVRKEGRRALYGVRGSA